MKEPRPKIGEARAMPTPRKSHLLLHALLRDYPGEIVTGFILDAHVQSYCLTGYIYKSPSHENGERVIAEVREVVDFGEYYVVHAGEYDSFVIVNFHPRGGRRAMRYMLALFDGAARAGSNFTRH